MYALAFSYMPKLDALALPSDDRDDIERKFTHTHTHTKRPPYTAKEREITEMIRVDLCLP